MGLDPERYQGLAGLRYAMRRFLAASEAISRRAGVTQPQYQALLAIKAWPDQAMTIKDLAEQLLLTHHGAVQLVDRLCRAGLAERQASDEDRRKVLLHLTAAGEEMMRTLAEEHLNEALHQEPLLTRSLRAIRRMGPEEA
jgi:DNA-binding MarR family transcriptional regulator